MARSRKEALEQLEQLAEVVQALNWCFESERASRCTPGQVLHDVYNAVDCEASLMVAHNGSMHLVVSEHIPFGGVEAHCYSLETALKFFRQQ